MKLLHYVCLCEVAFHYNVPKCLLKLMVSTKYFKSLDNDPFKKLSLFRNAEVGGC